MVKKLAFLVDTERCIGCHSCEMACKNEYQHHPKVRWRKVYPMAESVFGVPERNFMSLACNHCDDPACLKVCPVIAYTKREDGIVLHDQQRCIGCRMCQMACPYGVPQYNEDIKKVEKCSLCSQRLDKGQKPACVTGCPMEAISVFDAGQYNPTGSVAMLPGFPDPAITQPTTRFMRPVAGAQVRRDR